MPVFTLGSLFDGKGAAPLAGTQSGFEPVWASEIDQVAVSVTSLRFPGMQHLGDIHRVRGDQIHPVHVIVWGSPCTNLSHSNYDRGGLEGEQSRLFHEGVRIIREMKEATNGAYPVFDLWENVPGAFSSNGCKDFAAVLSGLAGAEVGVPAGGWTRAGVAFGPDRQTAWRTLDAQFFGVPQRRKRVWALTDHRGHRAAAALFEPYDVSGFSPPDAGAKQEADGERTTANPHIARSTAGPATGRHKTVYAVDWRNYRENPEISGTLQAKNSGGWSLNYQNPIRIGWTLRRFTRNELERLNGFPDGHMAVGTDTDAGRMAGNTMAVPVVRWILRRVWSFLEADRLGVQL